MAEETRDELERRLDRLAWFLDSSLRVPVLGVRVGFDSLIGLVPGLGDLVGAALSLYLIREATRLELPRATLARMLGNVLLELVVGTVPVLGDVFDVAFKANRRNVALLREARRRRGAS